MRASIAFALALCAHQLAFAESPERWHEVSGGAWKVSPAIVAEMLGRLQLAANRAASLERRKTRPIARYTVQFQGTMAGNSKQVLLRGRCDAQGFSARDLTSQWRIVLDGGDCYYTATYDPSAKRFLSFMFNGEA